MTRARKFPWCAIAAHAPVVVGALVLTAGACLLIANLALHACRRPMMQFAPPLAGVTIAAKPHLTIANVLDGYYQAAFARQIGLFLPVYRWSVELRDQLEFSIFGVSATPGLVLGHGDSLLEIAYVDDYCTRNVASFLPGARIWAERIREMQDEVERRGQTCLYVLTPSKLAQYPGILPAGLSCPSSEADRTGLVPAWTALVRAAGIHAVDTTALIREAQHRYPFELYPAGGVHWNQVARALATQAVMRAIRAQRHDDAAPFTFTWHMAGHSSGEDLDLARLMNTFFMVADGPAPVVTLTAQPDQPGCAVRSIVMVGGSFLHGLGELLSKTACHPVVIAYEYWHSFKLIWRGDDGRRGVMDDRQRARDIDDAQIIIYEENEQLLGHSQHGPALYEYLLGHPPHL